MRKIYIKKKKKNDNNNKSFISFGLFYFVGITI